MEMKHGLKNTHKSNLVNVTIGCNRWLQSRPSDTVIHPSICLTIYTMVLISLFFSLNYIALLIRMRLFAFTCCGGEFWSLCN